MRQTVSTAGLLKKLQDYQTLPCRLKRLNLQSLQELSYRK